MGKGVECVRGAYRGYYGMVGKNWGRYKSDCIYVVLTPMGGTGEGVSSLLCHTGRVATGGRLFNGVDAA